LPKERLEAILEPSESKILRRTYAKSLGALGLGYNVEIMIIREIFEIIGVSLRPLLVSQL
jgi:hypothetical protein